MPLAGLWSRLTSGIVGFATGAAAADAIAPVLEPARQRAEALRPFKVLDPSTAAEAASELLETPVDLADDALRGGLGSARFAILTDLALRAPGVAQALELWRRDAIGEPEVDHALRKAHLPKEWWKPLKELRTLRLSPADVANAVQQSFLPNDGILSDPDLPGPPYSVPFETVNIDPHDEAIAGGIDDPRLKVLAQLSGNPPGPMELLDLWNRKVIDEQSVDHGIREGRTKTKWTQPLKELRHFLLSPAEAAGLRLRGWITPERSYELGELRGASQQVMDWLYLNRGRPATTHQVFIGLRRGGSYDGPTDGIPEAFERSVRQSDLRPEWLNLLWAGRHLYPSAFVLRALTQSGDLTAAETEQVLLFEGWEPTFARKVATRWAAGGGSAEREQTLTQLTAEYEGEYITEADYRAALGQLGYPAAKVDLLVHLTDAKRVAHARDQAVERLHKLYIAHGIDDPTALDDLRVLGVAAAAAQRMVGFWGLERDVTRKELTPTQVKRAYVKGIIDQPTALAELVERGYSDADAGTFLAE